MAEPDDVISDLTADGAELDRLVADLAPSRWSLPTPAPGWTIAHQVAHLTMVFNLAELAAADAAGFQAMTTRMGGDFDAAVNTAIADQVSEPPEKLFERWRKQRAATDAALAAAPPDRPVPWLVNPLPPGVLAAAGMMELFGHGQDIADTLSVRRQHTDRLRHLVGFAVRTRDFGYLSRGMTPPEEDFRFEIVAPSGALWEFGPADAAQRISGPAIDLCLLVTRRRHHADLAVTATGVDAERWLELAQAYRGPAGPGRAPGQFAALDG